MATGDIRTDAIPDTGRVNARSAGWLLVSGPLMAVLGSAIAFIAMPDQTMTDIEQVRHSGWIAFHLLADVGVVLFAAGLALLASRAISNAAMVHLIQGLSWLTAGLALLVMIVAGYAGPALASTTGTVAIADPDQLALLLNLVESFGNGTFLIMGILAGVVILAVGAGGRRTGVLSRRTAMVAAILGAVSGATNLWLWMTSDATDTWMLGIAANHLLLLWALVVGVFLLRRG